MIIETQQLLMFIAAGWLLNLTPGPDVLYIVSNALRSGTRAGIVAGLGITAGCFVHIFAAAVGVGALLATSATAFTVLKWIGAAFGGTIVRAQQLMHGKTSVITTTQKGVFAGLPEKFTVNRYHSLAIERATCPDVLEITAWTEDGEIMGVRHKTLAIEGVQFHPESILTEHGHAMLKNFLEQRA